MQLSKLKIAGFRSLKEAELDFDTLTVLIGENDSGKSSVLDSLDIFLENRRPEETDYYLDKLQNRCDNIEITLELFVEEIDDELAQFVINDKIIVKKIFSRTGDIETLCWGTKPKDN